MLTKGLKLGFEKANFSIEILVLVQVQITLCWTPDSNHVIFEWLLCGFHLIFFPQLRTAKITPGRCTTTGSWIWVSSNPSNFPTWTWAPWTRRAWATSFTWSTTSPASSATISFTRWGSQGPKGKKAKFSNGRKAEQFKNYMLEYIRMLYVL